jgi:glycosyltransferase involved in cell wall biosynthesis
VEGDAPRPLWTVLIPTWNCAAFLEQTLASVLVQDPGADRMEIIVVDDHSTKDDPEEVVNRVGGGRVRFIRQQQNVGKVRNYESGISASRGRLIHQLHGDDRVKPGFYKEMESAFSMFPEAGAFFCQSIYINDAGEITGRTGIERPEVGLLDNWLPQIVVQQHIQTPSMVLRREVYETVGGFDRRLDMCEDWEMWIRTATKFQVGFIPEALAEYRISQLNTTTRTTFAGTRAAVLRKVIEIADSYLPSDIVRACHTDRNRAMAQYIAQFIPALMKAKRYTAVARTWRDALTFSVDARTCYRLASYTRNWQRLPGG